MNQRAHQTGRYVAAAGTVLLVCMLLASLPAFGTVPLTGGGNKGALHKQVNQLEQQWQTALLANDTPTLSAMLGDSYVGIGPDGTIASKAEEIQARVSGEDRVQMLHVLDRKIRVYGSTAVVTSRVRVQGIYAGEPLLGEYRYTRVWSLGRGQWHVVSFEANRIHDADERSR